MNIPQEWQQFKLTAQQDLSDAEQWLFKEYWRFASWVPLFLRLWLDFLIPSCLKVSGAADLSTLPIWPDILDQLALGACIDNAVDTLLEYDEAKDGDPAAPSRSRLFMYGNARGWTSTDSGSTLKACLEGVRKYGVCAESLWPYDITQFAVKPPPAAWADAANHKGGNYFTLVDLDDMMVCLDQGYPFAICMGIFDNFYRLTASTCLLGLPADTDSYRGGHSVVIYGYDLKRRVFLAQNSWGKGFAKGGRFEISFDLMADPLYVWEARTIRRIANP